MKIIDVLENEISFESIMKKASRFLNEDDVTVKLPSRKYYLEETLLIDNDFCKGKGNRLSIVAKDNCTPCISGAIKINPAWEKVADGKYRTKIDHQELNNGFYQLFVNGKRKSLSRYPKGEILSPLINNFEFIEGADKKIEIDVDPFSGHAPKPHKEIYLGEDFFKNKDWSKPKEWILHIFPEENWQCLQFEIKDLDKEKGIVYLGKGGFQQFERFSARPGTSLGATSRFFIENIKEAMYEGTWYFDRFERELYYMPLENEDINSLVFEVPILRELVKIKGSEDLPVTNVSFRNIHFSHTTRTIFDKYEYPSMGDWGIVRSGAILLEDTKNITIDGCFIDAVGGNGIFVNEKNQHINIKNNLITETGESAIAVVGETILDLEKYSKCEICGHNQHWGFLDKPKLRYSSEVVIDNNKIHDIGAYGKQIAGVFIAISERNTIRHNEMYNIPRAAICIHDGVYGGHLIEYNYLHHTCRETDEHGTFNAWGRDRWWCHAQSHKGVSHGILDVLKEAKFTNVLRNNLMLDFKGWGIDLDDGSSNYDIYENVCIGVGIKTREGDLRNVHHNIVYLPTSDKPTAIQVGVENNKDRWHHNIIYSNYDCIHMTLPPKSGKVVKYMDNQCYYSTRGYFASRGMDFDTWKSKYDIDENSIFKDPMFSDPEKLDFSLSENSELLEKGFHQISLDYVGLVDFNNRYVSIEPFYPIYDKDTMNRDDLKMIRIKKPPIEPNDKGEFHLSFEEAKINSGTVTRPDIYYVADKNMDANLEWKLKYVGGEYEAEIKYNHYKGLGLELDIEAFVESIGRNSKKIIIDKEKGTISFMLSLSGEVTDIVSINLKIPDADSGIVLESFALYPKSN